MTKEIEQLIKENTDLKERTNTFMTSLNLMVSRNENLELQLAQTRGHNSALKAQVEKLTKALERRGEEIFGHEGD